MMNRNQIILSSELILISKKRFHLKFYLNSAEEMRSLRCPRGYDHSAVRVMTLLLEPEPGVC